MHGGAYTKGAYTWSKTSGKEKEGTYLQGWGRGVIGRTYSMQSSPTLTLFRPGGLYGPPERFLSITFRAFEVIL